MKLNALFYSDLARHGLALVSAAAIACAILAGCSRTSEAFEEYVNVPCNPQQLLTLVHKTVYATKDLQQTTSLLKSLIPGERDPPHVGVHFLRDLAAARSRTRSAAASITRFKVNQDSRWKALRNMRLGVSETE